MAIIAPMAKWRPLTRPTSTTPLKHDIICLHTMVGTLEGSWSWSNREGGTYWQFGLGGDGELWQCCDLAYRSAANLEGNWHCIPIETEDTNAGIFPTPYANPLWTPAQLDKLEELIAWLCVRFNIPPVLIPDTRSTRRGIGFHVQGIQGSPYYKGGENWSKPFNGKTCPNRRITQVNDLIKRVQRRLQGVEDDMFTDDDREMLQRVHAAVFGGQQNGIARQTWALEVAHFATQSGSAADLLRKIHADLADEEPAPPA